MVNDATDVALDETHDAVKEAAQGVVFSNIVLTLVFALSFKTMWYLLSVMQIIVLVRSFAAWPAIVDEVIKQVLDAITLDPVVKPIIDYGKSKFELADDETDDEYLRQQGLQRKSILDDMGIFYIVLLLTLVVLVVFIIVKIVSTRVPCCRTVLEKLRAYLVFTAPLQYVVSSYFRLVGIFFSLLLVGIKRSDEIWEVVIYGSVVCFFFVWPLWVFWFLLRSFDSLGDPDFFAKFRSLYTGIKLSSAAAISYKAAYAVRRFDIIFDGLVFTQDSPITGIERNHYFEKVIIFLILQTCYIGYIFEVHPHDTVMFNRLELINEFLLCLLGYTMLLFTGLNRPVNEDQFETGRIVALFVILLIYVINLGVMIHTTGYHLCIKARAIVIQKQKCLCLLRLCPGDKVAQNQMKKGKQAAKRKKFATGNCRSTRDPGALDDVKNRRNAKVHVDLLALDKCDAQPNLESDWTPEASIDVADMEEHTQRGTYA